MSIYYFGLGRITRFMLTFSSLSLEIETMYLSAISESVSPGLTVTSFASEGRGIRNVKASEVKIKRSIRF